MNNILKTYIMLTIFILVGFYLRPQYVATELNDLSKQTGEVQAELSKKGMHKGMPVGEGYTLQSWDKQTGGGMMYVVTSPYDERGDNIELNIHIQQDRFTIESITVTGMGEVNLSYKGSSASQIGMVTESFNKQTIQDISHDFSGYNVYDARMLSGDIEGVLKDLYMVGEHYNQKDISGD